MKRIIIGITCGLIVVLLLQLAEKAISYFIYVQIIKNVSPYETAAFYKTFPIQLVFILLYIFSFLFLILSGIVTGFITKKNGMKYGLIVGIVTILVPLIFILISVIFPQVFYGKLFAHPALQQKIISTVLGHIKDIPINLTLTAMGGYFGEKLSKRNKKI